MFNISFRRNGGLYFIKIGRLYISFCITRNYKPMHHKTNNKQQFGVPHDQPLSEGYR